MREHACRDVCGEVCVGEGYGRLLFSTLTGLTGGICGVHYFLPSFFAWLVG